MRLGIILMNDEPQIPNCRNCRYFYITWDAKKPYGCRAMQFKSSVLPTIEVLEADGAVCISFRKRKIEERAPRKSDGKKNIGSNLNLKA